METFFIQDPYFNAKDILECGQIFRYTKKEDDSYGVFSADKYALISSDKTGWRIQTDDKEYFRHFFDMETDYGGIISRLNEVSPILKEATEYGKGIRILNQDLFETIISFIISSNNNIKRIQLIIERLCFNLGEKTPYGYAFPTKKALSSVSADFFKQIGAGYRADYLAQTAKRLYNDFDLEELKSTDTDRARKKLMELKGIGPKVADCILLFGLRRFDVFPVDVWIKKVYHKYFECGLPDCKIADFFVRKFDNLAGFAQQYLYYFLRSIDK